ncbi:MAG: hypothetical protein ACT4NL_08995 [Pseudomarimonas sp.]
MNSNVAPHLALILFLPWYAVLGWLLWRLRATGHDARRKLAVSAYIGLSLVAAGFGGIWAYGYAEPLTGSIWKQILASTVGYGAFLAGLLIGFASLRSAPASTRARSR